MNRIRGRHYTNQEISMIYYRGKKWDGKVICWVIDPFNEFGNVVLHDKDILTSSFTMTGRQRMLILTITL